MWPLMNFIPLIGWNYSIQTGIQPMSPLEFITGHMVYNPGYA